MPLSQKKYLISVAMATFNGKDYIQEQIDSILTQTTPPDEIIIVDDASNDGTIDILESYEKKFQSISLLRNQKNLGINKSFSKAINNTNGDLIFISDQDDNWLPDKISTMYKNWNGAHLVCSDASIVDINKNVLKKSEFKYFNMNFDGTYKNPFQFLLINSLSGHNMAISKEMKKYIFPFPNNTMYDQWFAIVAHSQNSISICRDILCLHRIHNSNSHNKQLSKKRSKQRISKADKKHRFFSTHDSIDEILKRMPEYKNSNHKELIDLFKNHHKRLENTIINIPLFMHLFKRRKDIFPDQHGWKRIRAIRNLSLGMKGYWLKI